MKREREREAEATVLRVHVRPLVRVRADGLCGKAHVQATREVTREATRMKEKRDKEAKMKVPDQERERRKAKGRGRGKIGKTSK